MATLGVVLLLQRLALDRRVGESGGRAWERGLAALGVLALLCWWNLGHFHFPTYLHRWELYHYVVGAKYFRELGYQDLYRCSTVADAESLGVEGVRGRSIRNPGTNRIEPAETVLGESARCGGRFSPGRWSAFKADIGWFERQMPPSRWQEAQQDHGFNATPVWLVAGSPLANLMPVSTLSLTTLALLDPLLLLVMWIAVWWAFGWRAACIAAIFWGSSYTARFWWTGGSFLRQDWLSTAVIGICLLRRGRHGMAGALLAWSASLRIFPVVFLGAIGLAAGLRMWDERRVAIGSEHRRFAMGALVALALLVPASLWVAGDAGVWSDFARNTRLHLSTSLTNDMGLPTLVAYDHATRARIVKDESLQDPYMPWKEARRSTFERRRMLYWLAVGLYLVLFARAIRGRDDWVTACLAVGLIPVGAELSCYYYSVFLCLGLLWSRERRAPLALLTFAAISCVIPAFSGWYDELFTATSVAALACVVYVTWLFAQESDEAQSTN